MENPDEGDIVGILESSRLEFTAAVAGLSEAQARCKPGEDQWCALECVEHVVVVEERFLSGVEQAERLDTPTVNREKEAEISQRVPIRETRVRALEAVRPTGRFATMSEALIAFNAARARTMRFADERRPDLYSLAMEHRRFGKLNGAEYLLLIAAHTRRHAGQILELKTNLV
jgi:uncharacterized damage-inducible protein DinB